MDSNSKDSCNADRYSIRDSGNRVYKYRMDKNSTDNMDCR